MTNAAQKAGAAAKAPTAAKSQTPAGDKAPKKPAKPRVDYGYAPAATIVINAEKEIKYRGARLAWYNLLKAHNGKKVDAFEAAAKGQDGKEFKDPPRGWIRFFVQDGACSLNKPAA